MLKRLVAVILSVAMMLSLTAFAGAEETTDGGMVLYYPSYLQESEGETLTLAKSRNASCACPMRHCRFWCAAIFILWR